MRAIAICASGDLLVFPEDADGRLVPNPGAVPVVDAGSGHVSLDQRESCSSEQSAADDQLVPWAQPAALDASLDGDDDVLRAAVGLQHYVHGCLPGADSAHDFAMAERKVGCLTHDVLRRTAVIPI